MNSNLHRRQDCRLGTLSIVLLLAAAGGCAGAMPHPGPGYFQSQRSYTDDSVSVTLGEADRTYANRAPTSGRRSPTPAGQPLIVRGQQQASPEMYRQAFGDAPASRPAGGGTIAQTALEFAPPPMPAVAPGNAYPPPRQYQQPQYQQPQHPPQPQQGGVVYGHRPASGGVPPSGVSYQGGPADNLPPPQVYIPNPNPTLAPGTQPFYPPSVVAESELLRPAGTPVDLDVRTVETRTGRFMFGVGVNSDAGLTGQIVIDERNFDIARIPTSFQDWVNGTAFRGAGQGFRLEAMPGSQVQRYLVNFTEPYLMDTRVSFNISGYYYERFFFDWDEQRVGGRIGLGYSLAPDLSVNAALRMENVEISDPRVSTVAELNNVLGESALYTGRFAVAHDTRDSSFSPTEGYLLELAYEQGFGDFVYPRGEIDYRRYFLLRERPDGSGRHTLAYNFQLGFSGPNTPLYENYFAGGYSTIRGFEFRGASPEVNGVEVGGEFRFLGSAEYMFPLTADDMMKGVVFCDFGTVERSIELTADNFRVAPGLGLRIFVPAMGPAPIALDFAFPVLKAPTDDTQMFSFFVGFGR